MITKFKGKYDFLIPRTTAWRDTTAWFLTRQRRHSWLRSMMPLTFGPCFEIQRFLFGGLANWPRDSRSAAIGHQSCPWNSCGRSLSTDSPAPQISASCSWLRATSGSLRRTTGTNNSGAVVSAAPALANTAIMLSAWCRAATTLERFSCPYESSSAAKHRRPSNTASLFKPPRSAPRAQLYMQTSRNCFGDGVSPPLPPSGSFGFSGLPLDSLHRRLGRIFAD